MITIYRPTQESMKNAHDNINKFGWGSVEVTADPISNLTQKKMLAVFEDEGKINTIFKAFNVAIASGDLQVASKLEIDDLEEMFHLTQNMNELTIENKGLFLHSGMSGDIVEMNGEFWITLAMGFAKINMQ